MSKITFIYIKNKYEMKLDKENLSMKNVLIKYSSIINIDLNDLLFIYNGKNLSNYYNKKINEINKIDLTIIVYNIKIRNNKMNKKNEELKNIICPECKNLAFIENDDNNIVSNCLNNHKYNDFTINSFINSQYNIESSIKCDKCDNNKYYYNKFYINSKREKICPLCLEKYNNKNNILDYEYRFIMCIKHHNKYISYCKNCNINLCEKCEEEEHKNHKIKSYKEMKLNNKRIEKSEMNNLK